MTNKSPPDELEFEPLRTGPSRKTIGFLAVLVAAGVGAFVVNNRNAVERKAVNLAIASNAWANLSRCLAGENPQIGQIARKSRKIELGVPTRVRRMPRAARAQQWPYRCATYAGSLTRALFDSKSEDRSHRVLAMFASQAATNLESGELHTGKEDRGRYLDELFATAEQARLPPPHNIPTAQLPPMPVEPLNAPLLEAILVGGDNARVMSQDSVARGDLRVISGTSDKNLCVFNNSGPDAQTGLSRARCTRLRLPAGTNRVALGSSDDGGPVVYTAINSTGSGRGEIARSQLSPAFDRVNSISLTEQGVRGFLSMPETQTFRVFQRAVTPCPAATDRGPCFTNDEPLILSENFQQGAVRGAWLLDTVALILAERPQGGAHGTSATSRDGGTASTVDAAMGPVADAAAPNGPREGVMYAGIVGTAANGAPALTVALGERGVSTTWATEPRVDSCRASNGDTAIVAYTADGHALVLWSTPTGFSQAISTEAQPGVIACDGDLLRIGWFSPIPVPTANTLTCTHTGCAFARAAAPDVDADPVIAPLGPNVLAAYTLRGGGGFRYRVAPLMDLAEADDHVVFDDLDHDGLQVDAQIPAFVRGRRAVVWVTSRGVAGETYAFRIDDAGRATPIRPAR